MPRSTRTRHFLTSAFIITASLSACADPAAPPARHAASEVPALFAASGLTASRTLESGLVGRVRARREAADVQLVRVAANASALLTNDAAVAIRVDGRDVVFAGVDRVASSGGGSFWSGRERDGAGIANLALTARGVTGDVTVDGVVHTLEPVGEGLHAFVRTDASSLPPEHPPGSESGALIANPSPAALARADGLAITTTDTLMDNGAPYMGVLVAYTPRVASLVGDISGLINVAIGETNRSFRNSQIGGSVYLTGTTQVTYNEVGSSYPQHIARLQGTTDGYMDDIHALRNNTLSDIVVLLVDDSTAGGQSAQIGASAATAFSVVYWKTATGYFSFPHELGHLFGGRHQRTSDGTSTPYVYGHGYVEPNKNWVTIMALPREGCGWNCPRLQYWSNPNVIEATMNEPMGTTAYEDMAHVIGDAHWAARDWRTIPAPTNVYVMNASSAGAQPVVQWTKTPGAESHSVYSCVFTGTTPAESCFSQRYGVYSDQGSTMTFTDVYGAGVVDPYPPDLYHPCPVRQVAYRVRAYSNAGLSPNSYQVSVCVK